MRDHARIGGPALEQQDRRVARGRMQRARLRRLDANVDRPVLIRERAQPRDEHLAREERQQRDPEHAALPVTLDEARGHVVELRQQRLNLRVQRGAELRERDLARAALEQQRLELLLETFDLVTHRGRRDAELFGRSFEAEAARGNTKRPQASDRVLAHADNPRLNGLWTDAGLLQEACHAWKRPCGPRHA